MAGLPFLPFFFLPVSALPLPLPRVVFSLGILGGLLGKLLVFVGMDSRESSVCAPETTLDNDHKNVAKTRAEETLRSRRICALGNEKKNITIVERTCTGGARLRVGDAALPVATTTIVVANERNNRN